MRGSGQSQRDRILDRDGFRCVYCARSLPPESLTLDHVEPRRRGGDNSDGNVVACCEPCNREKGSLAAWAFLAQRPVQRANFLELAVAVWPRLRRAIEEAARAS